MDDFPLAGTHFFHGAGQVRPDGIQSFPAHDGLFRLQPGTPFRVFDLRGEFILSMLCFQHPQQYTAEGFVEIVLNGTGFADTVPVLPEFHKKILERILDHMIVCSEFMSVIEEWMVVGLEDNFEGGFIPETKIVPYEFVVLHSLAQLLV